MSEFLFLQQFLIPLESMLIAVELFFADFHGVYEQKYFFGVNVVAFEFIN